MYTYGSYDSPQGDYDDEPDFEGFDEEELEEEFIEAGPVLLRDRFGRPFRGHEVIPTRHRSPEHGKPMGRRRHHHGFGFGHWLNNAIKTCGREINKGTIEMADESGRISKGLSKIPVVGGLLHSLYDLAFQSTLGAIIMTEEVTIGGQRIDRVVLTSLKAQLADVKEIAPYAQMVCSFIPGIGPGISAAIGAGLALANGQPLSAALLDGVKGALPGGPLAKMAFDAGEATVTSVVEHKPLSWQSLASEGIQAVAAGINLPIPDVAKNALEGVFNCAGALVQGKPLDKTLISSFASALPIPPAAQSALISGADMADSVAHGQKVDQAFLSNLGPLVKALPIPPNVAQQVMAAKQAAMPIVLSHAVTDVFFDTVRGRVPKGVADSVSIAIAAAQAGHVQTLTATQLTPDGPVMRRLMAQGQALLSDAVIKAAYATLPPNAQKGFQVGAGLSRQQCNPHQLITLRNALTASDKKGFDLAMSLHIGRVTAPAPAHTDPAAIAGYFATNGLQGQTPDNAAALMQTMAQNPMMKVGAISAVALIAKKREGWWPKVKRRFADAFSPAT